MSFLLLQEVTFLEVRPGGEEASLEESFSAEQQGRALFEGGVKEEPGETEGCAAALLSC